MGTSINFTPRLSRFAWIPALLLCLSCQLICFGQSKKTTESLLQADRDFARMGKERGLQEAFTFFADSEAILLRDGTEPIRGLEAIKNSFAPGISEILLVWEPEFAIVAKSGDLGYTVGHHQTVDSEGKVLSKGSYTTFWRKNKDGEWKWTIDVGIKYK